MNPLTEWVTYARLIIIGLGGGWDLPSKLAFFCEYFMPTTQLVLVDGGQYTGRQRDHEHFLQAGPKVRIQTAFLRREFPDTPVIPIPKYVGTSTSDRAIAVEDLLRPGDVVFLQVDNNQTRHLVEEHAHTLSDTTLLCGGTNDDQLRVMVYLRRHHHDLTPRFSSYCNAIAHPTDQSPLTKENCTEPLGREAHFHPFTMLAASAFLLSAFYQVWRRETDNSLDEYDYSELWYDITSGRCRTEHHKEE